MITSEWATEHWQFGKDKDSIISLHVTRLIAIQITLRILIILKILKDCGLIFTIHTVMIRIEQLVTLSLEMMIFNLSDMMLTTQRLSLWDLFWEVMMKEDILDLMVFLLKWHLELRREHLLTLQINLKDSLVNWQNQLKDSQI
jgi:hypothetical protein